MYITDLFSLIFFFPSVYNYLKYCIEQKSFSMRFADILFYDIIIKRIRINALSVGLSQLFWFYVKERK